MNETWEVDTEASKNEYGVLQFDNKQPEWTLSQPERLHVRSKQWFG